MGDLGFILVEAIRELRRLTAEQSSVALRVGCAVLISAIVVSALFVRFNAS